MLGAPWPRPADRAKNDSRRERAAACGGNSLSPAARNVAVSSAATFSNIPHCEATTTFKEARGQSELKPLSRDHRSYPPASMLEARFERAYLEESLERRTAHHG